MFNSNVKSVLPYVSERLRKKIIAQLQNFTKCKLRYISGMWLPKNISNQELWQRIRRGKMKLPYGDGKRDGSATL